VQTKPRPFYSREQYFRDNISILEKVVVLFVIFYAGWWGVFTTKIFDANTLGLSIQGLSLGIQSWRWLYIVWSVFYFVFFVFLFIRWIWSSARIDPDVSVPEFLKIASKSSHQALLLICCTILFSIVVCNVFNINVCLAIYGSVILIGWFVTSIWIILWRLLRKQNMESGRPWN
jgi:hypothetical protein